MPSSNIIRLAPNGPHGKLELRGPFPKEFRVSDDDPIQRGYRYLEDEERGVLMSVWDSTPITTTIHTFPRNEFFSVVDGSVTIIDAAGRESTFRSGDCFVFPQGLKSVWKQTEYFRKYAVGFTDASAQEPANPSDIRVLRLDPNRPLEENTEPLTDTFLSPVPIQHEHRWFADRTGQMIVRVWDTTACHCKPSVAPLHEWTHILDGSVAVTDARGTTQHFTRGETFIVPFGTVYGWRCDAYLRVIACTFRPKATVAKAQAAE